MLGFTPFKKHANKFNYIPRYYDPEKERRASSVVPSCAASVPGMRRANTFPASSSARSAKPVRRTGPARRSGPHPHPEDGRRRGAGPAVHLPALSGSWRRSSCKLPPRSPPLRLIPRRRRTGSIPTPRYGSFRTITRSERDGRQDQTFTRGRRQSDRCRRGREPALVGGQGDDGERHRRRGPLREGQLPRRRQGS